MNPDDLVAELTALAAVLVPITGIIGASLGYWAAERKSRRETVAAASTAESTAQDRLIDQLQEELGRYRAENDKRVQRLETAVGELTELSQGYREFIGVQRDHMAQHGVPLPPWPAHLPR